MAKEYPFYCAGSWRSSSNLLEVKNPHDDGVVGVTSFAFDSDLDDAINAAEDAFQVMRSMPTYERANALHTLARLLEQRKEEVALLIAKEAGKPLRDSRVETDRGVFTIQ